MAAAAAPCASSSAASSSSRSGPRAAAPMVPQVPANSSTAGDAGTDAAPLGTEAGNWPCVAAAAAAAAGQGRPPARGSSPLLHNRRRCLAVWAKASGSRRRPRPQRDVGGPRCEPSTTALTPFNWICQTCRQLTYKLACPSRREMRGMDLASDHLVLTRAVRPGAPRGKLLVFTEVLTPCGRDWRLQRPPLSSVGTTRCPSQLPKLVPRAFVRPSHLPSSCPRHILTYFMKACKAPNLCSSACCTSMYGMRTGGTLS